MAKECKPRIAAQLYTVRAFTQTEESIAETLRKVKEAGYDSVQISAFGKCGTDFLADILARNELTVCATHTPYERIVGDTEAVIAEHLRIGAPCVGLGFRRVQSLAEGENFIKEMTPAAKKIRDAGLRFVYHNHQWEFIRLDGGITFMEYYLENTSAEEFGLLPDMYWLQYAGVSPAKFLLEHADRIDVIHLKDMQPDAESGVQKFCEVGEGNMDYADILSAAAKAGVRFAAVEQDDCYGKDPFDCLARSRKNLARMGY